MYVFPNLYCTGWEFSRLQGYNSGSPRLANLQVLSTIHMATLLTNPSIEYGRPQPAASGQLMITKTFLQDPMRVKRQSCNHGRRVVHHRYVLHSWDMN